MKLNLTLSLTDQINLVKQKEAFEQLSREEILDLLLITMGDIMRLDNEIKQRMKDELCQKLNCQQ